MRNANFYFVKYSQTYLYGYSFERELLSDIIFEKGVYIFLDECNTFLKRLSADDILIQSFRKLL
jgi:hypothetical protein